MFATVLTFLSTRIISVVVTTVVVVAAVPTLIVAINGNTITITTGPVASSSRHHDEDERTRIVVEVKNAANTVVVKLNDAEASCGAQISQLASQSKLSATATAAALKKGKDDFHATVAPFLNEIKADEDELEHLTVVTTEVEQAFLVRINTILVTALGEDGHAGVLITVCQTIIVHIEQIIVVVQAPSGDAERDSDIRTVR